MMVEIEVYLACDRKQSFKWQSSFKWSNEIFASYVKLQPSSLCLEVILSIGNIFLCNKMLLMWLEINVALPFCNYMSLPSGFHLCCFHKFWYIMYYPIALYKLEGLLWWGSIAPRDNMQLITWFECQ